MDVRHEEKGMTEANRCGISNCWPLTTAAFGMAIVTNGLPETDLTLRWGVSSLAASRIVENPHPLTPRKSNDAHTLSKEGNGGPSFNSQLMNQPSVPYSQGVFPLWMGLSHYCASHLSFAQRTHIAQNMANQIAGNEAVMSTAFLTGLAGWDVGW